MVHTHFAAGLTLGVRLCQNGPSIWLIACCNCGGDCKLSASPSKLMWLGCRWPIDVAVLLAISASSGNPTDLNPSKTLPQLPIKHKRTLQYIDWLLRNKASCFTYAHLEIERLSSEPFVNHVSFKDCTEQQKIFLRSSDVLKRCTILNIPICIWLLYFQCLHHSTYVRRRVRKGSTVLTLGKGKQFLTMTFLSPFLVRCSSSSTRKLSNKRPRYEIPSPRPKFRGVTILSFLYDPYRLTYAGPNVGMYP